MKIDIKNFETLVIKNWTKFIDPRQMFSFIKEIASTHLDKQEPINSVRLTRFELTSQGIIIWVEYIIGKKGSSVNAVSSFLLIKDEFQHLQSLVT
jgi:hypothetical protein